MKIKFNSEPVYGDNDKFKKWKRKIYDGNINTNFQGKKVPKGNASYKFLSLLMLDSIVKVKKKYYLQTHLEECKYEIRRTKIENLINDELEASASDDKTESDSDNDETESDNEKDNDQFNE